MKCKTNSIVKFLLILFFLFGSTLSIFAQYEDLERDKNIIWIAEFSNDYTFSLNDAQTENTVKLIKFKGDPSNFIDAYSSSWIIDWIFYNAIDDHYDCYKDKGITQPLSAKDINDLIAVTDTIITFNPDTYEEMVQIVRNQISLNNINGLRVNQVIYYDKKKENFNTRIISVAPLLLKEKVISIKPRKVIKNFRPLFWIKMDGTLPRKFKIKSSSIDWAALVLSKKNPIDLNSIKTVKTNYGFDIKKRLYEQAFKFEKSITRSYKPSDKLKMEDLKRMYTSIDTVITFDPDTYEEQVRVVRKDLKLEEVSNIRLVQEWYYDKKRKRLMNRLKAICPIVEAKDDNGKFRFWKPLYYIKYD